MRSTHIGRIHGAKFVLLAFLLGGFIQTAGRLCRSNLRPLFLKSLPAPPVTIPPTSNKSNGLATSTPSGLNGTPESGKPSAALTAAPPAQPSPTELKPLYDAAGIFVSVLLLNYTAAPFMILGVRDSLRVWSRLGWYGHWMLGACLAFFWSGGARLLPRAPKPRRAEEPGTPGVTIVPPVDAGLREVEKKFR